MSALVSRAPVPPPPAPGLPDGAAAAPAARGRASWSGLVRLGLVAVPVKGYPAVVPGPEVHFHQLHAGCGQRIRAEKHCPVHGQVDAGALASGYPYAPDQDVLLDAAALDRLRPAQDRALCLEHFLEPGQLDPALFAGRTLYLLPDGPAAQHPYAVLAQALAARGKWALGRLVLAGHRHPALVRPARRLLTVHLLHDPSQLRDGAGLEAALRPGALSDDEQRLAALLIDAPRPALAWSAYRDDFADRVAALVEATVRGRPLPAPAAPEGPVLHLLAALQQSVAALRQAPAAAAAAPARRPRRPPAARRSP